MTNNDPQVYLTVNKSRRKGFCIYRHPGSPLKYYLKNGEEFEIEIFNPTTDVISADISINGKSISNRVLVLRPGERVFLERYLDSNKKFKFDTYEVDGSGEAQKAIENNGSVSVSFKKQKETPDYFPVANLDWINVRRSRSTFGGGYVGQSNTSSYSGPNGTMSLYSASLIDDSNAINCCATPVETGRVEEGSISNQEFTNVNYEWEYTSFYTTEFKIYPTSAEPAATIDDYVQYCSGCGKKRKKNDQFCPKCGTKY
jgi:hypothetical protein